MIALNDSGSGVRYVFLKIHYYHMNENKEGPHHRQMFFLKCVHRAFTRFAQLRFGIWLCCFIEINIIRWSFFCVSALTNREIKNDRWCDVKSGGAN